jgi:hypothetical protein
MNLRSENIPSNGLILVARSGPSRKAAGNRTSPVLLICLCLLGSLSSGCVSKSNARLQAEKAFLEGQQKALVEQQQQLQPAVWFRGDIRNQRVPWTEGLTLSRALLAAQYTWSWDPRTITVTRAGELYAVDAKRLLRGLEDPELEPGDVVEVRH